MHHVTSSPTFRRSGFAVLALVLLATTPRAAQAYLDPGAGSMMLQIILGGLAGLAVGIRLVWHRIVGWLAKPSPTPAEPGATSDPASDAAASHAGAQPGP